MFSPLYTMGISRPHPNTKAVLVARRVCAKKKRPAGTAGRRYGTKHQAGQACGTLTRMMGWEYGGMMAGAGVFGTLLIVVVLVDLVLLGIWLWQHISK